ncbi:MAG: hypothetical protein C0483_11380 [Pirellula sp.]|nr:hypothetical protein [Pirellula sp.]
MTVPVDGSKLKIASKAADAAIAKAIVTECRKIWVANASRDLEARHELGKLLNERLGSPEARQKRGAETMKQVANALKTSRSELTRLRQFAAQYSNVAEFLKRRSDCKNRTLVKQALVKTTTTGNAERAAGAKSPITLLMFRIHDVTEKLKHEEMLRDTADNSAFREALKAPLRGRRSLPEV